MGDASGDARERRPHAVQADTRILAAVRERLVFDPRSSMAQLAGAADVGMSAIYSRFGSREQLLRRLADEGTSLWADALQRAHDALDRGEDAWVVLEAFLRTASAADVLALGALIGRTGEERARMEDLGRSGDELVHRLAQRGAVREGVTSSDLGKLLEAVGSVRGDGAERTRMVKARMLDIAIDGLRAGLPPLTGDAPGPRDFDPGRSERQSARDA